MLALAHIYRGYQKRRRLYPTLFQSFIHFLTQIARVIPLLFFHSACWRLCALSPDSITSLLVSAEQLCSVPVRKAAEKRAGRFVAESDFHNSFPV